MGDLFDEFMRELERRRAAAEGRPPRPRPGDDARRVGGDPPGPDDLDAEGREDGDAEDAGTRLSDDEPTPIRPRGRPGGPRPRTPGGSRAGGNGGPPRGSGRPVGGPDDGATPPSIGRIFRRLGLAAVGIVILLVILLASVGIDLWTDVIWYQSIGFASVLWTRLGAQLGLFLAGLGITLLVLLGTLWLAGRLVPPADPSRPGVLRTWSERLADAQRRADHNARLGGTGPFGPRPGSGPTLVFEADDMPDLVPVGTWVIALFSVLLALGVAGAFATAWETILLWSNGVPFSPTASVVDPVFQRDIGFFLFDLPFLRFVQSLVNGLLLAALAVAGARYLLAATRGGEVFVTRVRVHLAVIAGLYLLSVAFGYQLDKYELVYSQAGVAVGVAYADANARFMAYDVLTFLSGIAGALLVAGAFTRWLWPLGAVVVIWFAASILLGRLYPEAVQRFSVDPNTYAQEERYIGNNIAMTQLGFGIEDWDSRTYGGTAPLTRAAIENEADTFTNARLWDYRPLQTTLRQVQNVRQYYDFVDVDTDRYVIDGTLRQVMLSGRELAIDKNPEAASWVNQRIIYTHGIGIAMVPVNEVTTEGQPRLWVRDLPPVSFEGAPEIVQPRIYFGEGDAHYVVVRARQAEFDYPRDTSSGSVDEVTSWSADTGVRLDSTLNRLLFALRFRDLDLLISDQITADSELLFHRTLSDRLGRIAPFLRYDKDPYVVVDDRGHLVYVQDAYTISDRFPHATWFNGSDLGTGSGLDGEAINYIRNSVKITMDAYDGTMRFYVSDPTDPLIRAWSGIFPGMFTALDGMGDGLADHLRVPEEQFNVQTRVYGRYHVDNPLTFFNRTDLWTVPEKQTNQQSLESEAYYVVMRMPGEPTAEFLLLQPMIAASRPNMISWVAARNDAPNYGAVRAYRFPTDTTIFGPAQIEARIDQDPLISAQISLWNQSGSSVVRGNLIVVPVGDSLLYLQPVYLQSTSAAFPEFQKIVVASPTTIVWGDSLAEALTLLLSQQGEGPGASPSPEPSPGRSAPPGPSATPGPSSPPAASPPPDSGLPQDVPGLVDYANTHFEAAQAALQAGDFATYGSEMEKVEDALAVLGRLTVASPQP
ncbi:MAG TPA: UPF0182 family protein [Candidatus Limnocylindrales bacterium]|nr:UPF0182 family protein [Candidatus Limnocylindrales bacterium]